MGLPFFVTISGSYRKFPEQVAVAIEEFKDLGGIVLSPPSGRIVSSLEGFVSLKGDLVENMAQLPIEKFPQAIALVEDSHLEAIKKSNILWLVAPNGYLGLASAFEMGYAIAHSIPIYCDQQSWIATKEPMMKAYVQPAIPAQLISGISQRQIQPDAGWAIVQRALKAVHQKIKTPPEYNATIAVGAMIMHGEKALLVKTYKWTKNGEPLWSIVGGRIEPGEPLEEARLRRVKQQTGLVGILGDYICTFDKLAGSPYRDPNAKRVYSDRIVYAPDMNVVLDNRATEFKWIYPSEVLTREDVEPNAKKAFESLLKTAA